MIDPEDIELIKRQIEAQIGDYEQAIANYLAFVNEWRERNDPARKRIQRFRVAAKEGA